MTGHTSPHQASNHARTAHTRPSPALPATQLAHTERVRHRAGAGAREPARDGEREREREGERDGVCDGMRPQGEGRNSGGITAALSTP